MNEIISYLFIIYIIIYLVSIIIDNNISLEKFTDNTKKIIIENNDIVDKNTNDWLQDIFDMREIITIPKRKEHVKKFCKSFDINETIFKATLINEIDDYDNIYSLKIGEIACAMSQQKVLQKFIDSDHSSLLMLEDDNTPFTNNIYKDSKIDLNHIKIYVKNAVKYLPSDWDVLYLGRCWDDCRKNIKINKYLYKTNRTLCHHAIAFSRNGAEKVLNAIIHPLQKPIDHVVATLTVNGIIDSYATIIPIFYQNRDELNTTVGNYDNLPICM